MTINFEKTIFAGNLGSDAEVRAIPDSDNYRVKFSVGVNSKIGDKNHTEWYKVNRRCSEKMANWARNNLVKGANVFVEGVKRDRRFKDNETQQYVNYNEIIASDIQLASQYQSEYDNDGGTAGDGVSTPYDDGNQQQPTEFDHMEN
jgi:single-stranded DNA-binding protein